MRSDGEFKSNMESKRDNERYKEKSLGKSGTQCLVIELWHIDTQRNLKPESECLKCLRKIKRVTRRDWIRNIAIREEVCACECIDVVQCIQGRRLRYFGQPCSPYEARPTAEHCFFCCHVHELTRKNEKSSTEERWINNVNEELEEINLNVYSRGLQTGGFWSKRLAMRLWWGCHCQSVVYKT